MKALLERELELVPPHDLDLSGLDGERVPTRRFDSVYYDTSDRALLRRGMTLRRWMESGAAAWQLKLPSGGARLELELPDGARRRPSKRSGSSSA
jgi:hypothetical protein